MDEAGRAERTRHLRDRHRMIAARWYDAIAPTGFSPLVPADVRRACAHLAAEAVAILRADPFAPDGARPIGAGLVGLRYLTPEALSATQQTLARELVADLPAARLPAALPRLTALLGELAAGFVAAATATILAEQEAARAVPLAERRRAEGALRAGEARFRAIFEHAAIGIALVDRSGCLVESNPALQRLLGYGGDELRGLALTRVTHPEDLAQDQALYAELVAGRRDHYQIEKRYVRQDGKLAWGRLTTSLVRDAIGAPQYAIGMVEDITGRKRAEERLHAVVTNAPIILFAVDRAGTITLSAGRGLAALGLQPGELVGRSAWASALPVPGLAEDLRRALAGEAFTATATVRGVSFEIRYVPLRDAEGDVAGVLGVSTDVTDRVRAERAARRLAVRLSPQEARVLPLLARADLRTYRAIGAAIHVEGETARGHAKVIARKLGLATSARGDRHGRPETRPAGGVPRAAARGVSPPPRPRRGVYDHPHRAEKSTGGGCRNPPLWH